MDNLSPFYRFPLHPELIKGLEESNYYRATIIQQATIQSLHLPQPMILQSPNGTGKTAAYCIALLERIARKYFIERWDSAPNTSSGNILGLIIVHNPELCYQVSHELQCISRHLPLSITPVISSMTLEDNWSELANTSIIIATPGIVAKFLSKKKLKLFQLCGLIVDEWDKIVLDQGLGHDLDQIIQKAHLDCTKHLIICSSSTYSQKAYEALTKLMPFTWVLKCNDQPIEAIISREVHHLICRAGSFENRIKILIQFLRHLNFYQAIIFSNIEQLSNDTYDALYSAGFSPILLSSSAKMDQKERLDRLAEFRDIEHRTLITTDMIARGLDLKSITVVISLDLPYDSETFSHRIGRSGRFGGDILSLTFYKRQESKRIQQLKEDCYISFEVFNPKTGFNDGSIPNPKLPPLNEIQLRNLGFLIDQEKQVQYQELQLEEEESFEVPKLPFCDLNSQYWVEYNQYCKAFSPQGF